MRILNKYGKIFHKIILIKFFKFLRNNKKIPRTSLKYRKVFYTSYLNNQNKNLKIMHFSVQLLCNSKTDFSHFIRSLLSNSINFL